MDVRIKQLATQLGQQLTHLNWQIVTAESCTGGGLAKAITEIAGSSGWFDRGYISYSNHAKIELLQVSPLTIEHYGAVSQQTASAMAEGALKSSHANLAIAITGIAGPEGGSVQKPVGTVYIAWKTAFQSVACKEYHFSGDRVAIREQTIEQALMRLLIATTTRFECDS